MSVPSASFVAPRYPILALTDLMMPKRSDHLWDETARTLCNGYGRSLCKLDDSSTGDQVLSIVESWQLIYSLSDLFCQFQILIV